VNSKKLGRAIEELERVMDRFLPALMSQAKILWEKGDYARIEKLFRRSAEFSLDNDVWKMNLAHTLFMQERFKVSFLKRRNNVSEGHRETLF
jgi:tetratricopeptide repeat protein 30